MISLVSGIFREPTGYQQLTAPVGPSSDALAPYSDQTVTSPLGSNRNLRMCARSGSGMIAGFAAVFSNFWGNKWGPASFSFVSQRRLNPQVVCSVFPTPERRSIC
jgi:hypothetical protein